MSPVTTDFNYSYRDIGRGIKEEENVYSLLGFYVGLVTHAFLLCSVKQFVINSSVLPSVRFPGCLRSC